MSSHVMLGVNKRIIPGGFCIRRKRKIPSPNEIKEAANRALASRYARGKEVHP